MASRGRVRHWHDDEGWGVVDCDAAPGGCWAHCSAVLVDAYPGLEPGQEVFLELETADQDGYAFRALSVWPADREPFRRYTEASDASDAFTSSLTIELDEPD